MAQAIDCYFADIVSIAIIFYAVSFNPLNVNRVLDSGQVLIFRIILRVDIHPRVIIDRKRVMI